MDEIKLIEIKDIPENINEELHRLHNIVNSDCVPQRKDWATEKIDDIHKLFFMGKIYITGENT